MPSRVLRKIVELLVCGTFFASAAASQDIVQTVLGSDKIFPRGPEAAANVKFGTVRLMDVGLAGRLCIADSLSHVVAEIDAGGMLRVVAGNGFPGYSGDGGSALSAALNAPEACLYDRDGSIFIADTGNHRVRRVNRETGVIATVVGNGVAGVSGDGGPALEANLISPTGLALSSRGTLYISDTDARNKRIRFVSGGIIRRLGTDRDSLVTAEGLAIGVRNNEESLFVADRDAKVVWRQSLKDELAPWAAERFASTGLGKPRAVTVNPANGDVLIADSENNRLWLVGSNGTPAPLPGSDGIAGPASVAVDRNGITYSTDENNLIWRIQGGTLTTYAGTLLDGSGGDGGDLLSASLSFPDHIAFNDQNSLFIAEGNRIRMYTPSTLTLATVAGTGELGFEGDAGPATRAKMRAPFAAVMDNQGNLIIADTYNNRVRKVTPGAGGKFDDTATIKTIAGNGGKGFAGDGGDAVNAVVEQPVALAVDRANNIYVGQVADFRVRKITPDGKITTFAAGIGEPHGLAFDQFENLYIADRAGCVIRKVTTTGVISTFAGKAVPGKSCQERKREACGLSATPACLGDGMQATEAILDDPRGIAFTRSGEMLISDRGNNLIRKVDRAGVISTVAGTGERGDAQSGTTADKAAITTPYGIAVAGNGDIYFAANESHKIKAVRRIPPSFFFVPEVSVTLDAGSPPVFRTLNMASTVTGIAFTASVLPAGVDWVSVTQRQGLLPGTLTLRFSAASLRAGVYDASLVIEVPGADPPRITVPISVRVIDPPPAMSVSPDALSFRAVQSDQPQEAALGVLNSGSRGLGYSATVTKKWLRVGRTAAPTASNITGTVAPYGQETLIVRADLSCLKDDPTCLAAGTNSGEVVLTGDDRRELRIPVAFSVCPAATGQSLTPPILQLSEASLWFQGSTSGTFSVLTCGGSGVSWQMDPKSIPGWLTVSQMQGSSSEARTASPDKVTVTARTAGLAPGRYTALLAVAANGAKESPQKLQVDLVVAGSVLPVVTKTGLAFAVRAAEGSPGAQKFEIVNNSDQDYTFRSGMIPFTDASSLVYSPDTGTVKAGGTATITVQPNVSRLGPGFYDGAITFQLQSRDKTLLRNVELLLVVAGTPADKTGTSRSAEGCEVRELKGLITSMNGGDPITRVPGGNQAAIAASIFNNCAEPFESGTVQLSPSDARAQSTLRYNPLTKDWRGTWYLPANSARNKTLELAVESKPALPFLSKVAEVALIPPIEASCVAIAGPPQEPVTMSAEGGAGGPFQFAAVGLPEGLTMDENGRITGAPLADGSYRVTITDRYGFARGLTCEAFASSK